jgi:hypothetical protein
MYVLTGSTERRIIYMNDTSFISSLLGAIAGIWAIAAILVVLRIVGRWKMFEKAQIAGWHSIIPFLNQYDWFRMAGFKSPWPIIGTVGTGVAVLLTGSSLAAGSSEMSAIGGFLVVVACGISGIMEIMSNFMIAARFGQGVGTGFLFWFFGDILCMVAGFSNWKYTPKDDAEGQETESISHDYKND